VLSEDDIKQLKAIAGRVRAEAVSILVVAARDRMLQAGVRRSVVREVIMGMEKDAAQQFEAIDVAMIEAAFGDLDGAD